MTRAQQTLVAQVMQELQDLVDALDTHGGRYARDLVRSAVSGSPRTPRRPRDLHPDLAAAVREIVADQCYATLGYIPVPYR